ncbi:MAG: AAA family ATPase [Actinobacteria bacterium]|nr:AAA family ATPase [Actinomycetota bacterium]
MTQQHPELELEQAYILHAYECLEASRVGALKIRDLTSSGPGGTFQARLERNVFDENLVHRLEQLELGNAALVFGRIDRAADSGAAVESFHIGRLAVADANREPVVVDWRAPVAEPFYRATGREQMGLLRRRHFVVEGPQLLALEDELFGEGHLGVGQDEGLGDDPRQGLRGYSTLLTALGRSRTGQLGDIVATIQAEQDEIIRSPQAGVLVVQGGPGTGKTVVALHRAAYLLYTHRFPLEDQGVLVIGPNRVFLRYIERVLPSLGEAGVQQVILADLIPEVQFGLRESSNVARVKGNKRIAKVIDKAITDRERPIREDVQLPYGVGFVRLRAEESVQIIKAARRRYHRHNQARRYVENEVWAALAASFRSGADAEDIRDALTGSSEIRAVLERMWPVLTPAQLLHDLFGSKALLKLAGNGIMPESDYLALYRERSDSLEDVRWSNADAALLDEARFLLGPRPRKSGKVDETDEIRTFGHIVVDEVQDLTPMQLRMVTRRSLSGSMTVVGDIAQATGPLAPNDWKDVLEHLPSRKTPRVVGLSVGYRIPAQIMELADKVMHVATPGLRAPRSVRDGDEVPVITAVESADALYEAVITRARVLLQQAGGGRTAIICPDDMVDQMSSALGAASVPHGRAQAAGLDENLSIVPASLAKGLELDDVIVVEPSAIVADDAQGLRLLYVTLTRSTRSLTVVHRMPLPDAML